MTRLANADHAALPWRITEVAPDFDLLDAWSLPATGCSEDFGELVALWEGLDPASDDGSWASRWLFRLRTRLGDIFGWDAQTNTLPIPGHPEASLRERLPADLPALEIQQDSPSPFRPIFATDREWTGELSNTTVHAVVQLGWVPQGDGAFRGHLGVYVKPRGRLGRVYMRLIAPFRHYVVYPALMRRIRRSWSQRAHSDR
ncbi:MAG: DUF2867 domain-containing protein [Deltaproteobacteria bacterium]|nr:DUF2867 domain-containing protein [Deltaproteobacteria bacterium]